MSRTPKTQSATLTPPEATVRQGSPGPHDVAVIPRVLSIAGTDPSGGAGIQADLKSIAAHGGYGMAVVTALVAQNTRGVNSVHTPPPEFLAEQLNAVSDDVQIDAVKIGMLATAEYIEVVDRWLERTQAPVVVVDPVMVATSGDRLLDASAEEALGRMLRHADLVTPNIPELAVLAGEPRVRAWSDVIAQAQRVAEHHDTLVLAKGGHANGDAVHDALVSASGVIAEFTAARIHTTNTHGTGCSLSSAIATLYAQTGEWASALEQAKQWLADSIRNGSRLNVGSGHGPVDHFATLRRRAAAPLTAGEIAEHWWSGIADVRADIDDLAFITGLTDGTLDPAAFRHYLVQDTLYLRDYSRMLAAASTLAPTVAEQEFWASGALNALAGETAVHAHFLGDLSVVDAAPKAPATIAYTNHLAATAARDSYAVLAAALLPCYWIYVDVGTRMLPNAASDTPYMPWLSTYEDPTFANASTRAIEIVTRLAADADSATRDRMWRAFRLSAEHELRFFAEPLEFAQVAAS
ncbi:bifunctional hydroxymethylpyrimidine kinase/phosphomethylpyrimidine kinase [Microbacterium sp. MPKO10]|uniref:bifunctional hydroxymethylpyrimidine kinase/phosphomethylpyrimidine kinase n=1 Tax=Microbacterium sp. MPKO10 TaxID=2989818 RepID=UPI00223584E1|nr:bifunctional hydroxymethylpyrimidine kinase/phosphomethylpyrimidine kinase [Microbacterium sp. MPKO10]MCW4457935.1 bifunctional hydroxymethylpyrimidine kinase/phosphomethylpyrimidine kinase [Microbacterium sp. MPKO10]